MDLAWKAFQKLGNFDLCLQPKKAWPSIIDIDVRLYCASAQKALLFLTEVEHEINAGEVVLIDDLASICLIIGAGRKKSEMPFIRTLDVKSK